MKHGRRSEFEWAGYGGLGCLVLVLFVVLGFAVLRAVRAPSIAAPIRVKRSSARDNSSATIATRRFIPRESGGLH
jgi:hypothetical protein